MILHRVIIIFQWIFLGYITSSYFIYLILDFISLYNISYLINRPKAEKFIQPHNEFLAPISIIVPAYNEAITITSSTQALLKLNYPEYEVIVVNDGSKDQTINVLIENFALIEIRDVYWQQIPTKPINRIFHSKKHHNLRVIDKINGGKSDALNAGINLSRYPMFCGIDADSILHINSLYMVIQPFIEHNDTIAAGGTIRALNGCTVYNGYIDNILLPKNLLALFQVIEYLRAFLFGRLGWSTINGLLVISGAFGLFKKDIVVEVGGYRPSTIGEDMELILKMHKHMRKQRKKYKILFIPDPICWTEVPEDLKTLRNQRVRWQHGLSECLTLHMDLLFSRHSGVIGWVAFPIMIIFEWLTPIIEIFGFIFMGVLSYLGYISINAFLMFTFCAFSLGIFNSVIALLLEELTFQLYPKTRDVIKLLGVAIIENFGYRQLNSYWRLLGFFRWALKKSGPWGEMKRIGV